MRSNLVSVEWQNAFEAQHHMFPQASASELNVEKVCFT